MPAASRRSILARLAVPLLSALSVPAIAAEMCKLPPLAGDWIDEDNRGAEVEITVDLPQTQSLLGNITLGTPRVRAVYKRVNGKPHTCRIPDGAGHYPPLETDFDGDLRLITKVEMWRIDGRLHLCMHKDGKHLKYWDAEDLKLRVVDEDTLEGEFTDYQATQPTPIRFHRKPRTKIGSASTWPCPFDEPPPPDKTSPGQWFRDLMESERQKAHGR